MSNELKCFKHLKVNNSHPRLKTRTQTRTTAASFLVEMVPDQCSSWRAEDNSLDASSNHAEHHVTGLYQNPNIKILGKTKAVKLAEACSVTFNNMDQTLKISMCHDDRRADYS